MGEEEKIVNNLIESLKQISKCLKIINERLNLLEMEIRLIKGENETTKF